MVERLDIAMKNKIKFLLFSILFIGINTFALEPTKDIPEVKVGQKPIYVENSKAKYIVAIVDTGYNPDLATVKLKLCKTGHWNVIDDSKDSLNSKLVHGTRVADILADKLQNVNYCAIIYQVFSENVEKPDTYANMNVNKLTLALNKAKSENITAINLSYSGTGKYDSELKAMTELSDNKVILFTAAGNNDIDLTDTCNIYPACYEIKNKLVIGARDYEKPSLRDKHSNYGKPVDIYAPGYKVNTEKPELEIRTSYATPRALAEYILFLESKNKANVF